MQDLIGVMRKAIRDDGRTMYRIAKDAKLPYPTIHRFAAGKRKDIGMVTAAKLCAALGLELVPMQRKGR